MERFKNFQQYQIFGIAVIIILIIFFLFWIGIDFLIPDLQERGTFGDKFGALNSLFSGLAFAGLIYTIYLQQEELRLQREELRQTREEMARQTKEFDEQNKTLQIQRFENTFFNMIGFLQQIVQGLSVNTIRPNQIKKHESTGRIRREFATEEITLKGIPVFEETYWTTSVWLKGIIESSGMDGFNSRGISLFDHYFQYLYRIMVFVDTSFSVPDFETRYRYMAMLRDHLSRYELIWLYYTGLSNKGQNLKALIEKYAMLRNLRKELIVATDKHVGEYSSSAFGL